MQRGDKLIIVRDEAGADSSRLVAALAALGIGLDCNCPYQETREVEGDGKEHRMVTWVLAAASECGRFETREMIRAWHENRFAADNPEHPFAYIKAAFSNLSTISEVTRAQPPVAVVRRGRRIAMIPFDATPERREELLTALDQ